MADNKLLLNLSHNLREVLEDDEYYDITIEVGNDPYIKIFRAHMVILHYRSPYLRRIFSTNKRKNDGTLTHIKFPNILPEIFQIILRYIYGGVLPLDECDTSDIIKILVAANELKLQELIILLQSFLIENKSEWMKQNFSNIYRMIFENNSFLELQKYCTDLISEDPVKIFESPNFSSTPEKLLVALIRNDKLQMSEIQLWDYVLKWGLSQNPELPSDPTNFSKEDFNTLKNRLQRCIQFINFYNLTSEEFYKVIPYKKIIPKELYKDLLTHFLNSNNKKSEPNEPNIVKDIENNKSKSNVIENIKENKETNPGSNIVENKPVANIVEDIKENKPIVNIVEDIKKNELERNIFEFIEENKLEQTVIEVIEEPRKIRNKPAPNIIKEIEENSPNEDDNYYKKEIDSKIITYRHAKLILKWINKIYMKNMKNMNNTNTSTYTSYFSKWIYTDTTNNTTNNPNSMNITHTTHKLKLLLRGTRDGFAPQKFHNVCDNRFHTVVVIKTHNNEIIGGYNPVSWKSDVSYSITKDSFIFSFKGDGNHILSRVVCDAYATYNVNWYGPSFGVSDLSLREGNMGVCRQNSYEKPIRGTTDDFFATEYEVFQIVGI
ncbi:hypothetical protein RhiirA4_474411 [Rhizophagus irregularis]|uniref:Kelch-like protein 17 n=1 Tax=Rhizophagus irregularis TaxID=588596 RepID=A0A2I1H8D3_9GLOM|nr:hypothetical protein RhiirA4_474411 [Rhizophagus irregularis]